MSMSTRQSRTRISRSTRPVGSLRKRAAGSLAAIGLLSGLALAVAPGAAQAATAQPAAATISYGETAQFHCSYGEVTLDNMRLPYAELPTSYEAFVYVYTNGWHYYRTMQAASGAVVETLANGNQEVYYQKPLYASVPHGYYYEVLAYVAPNAAAGYLPHYDVATISLGYPGAGSATYCAA